MTNGTPSPDTHPEWLAEAISVANVPTLACMLVQLTGERRWIEGRFMPSRTRGLEDNDDGGLPVEVQEEIRAAALAALTGWFDGRPAALLKPSDALLQEMMSVTLGDVIPADYAPMIRHELQLPEPGTAEPVCAPPPGFTALIIGGGISGLCAAVQFKAAGVPYVIVERRTNLGGVWFDNRYPAAACDVPSHLYSFSFAPFEWSRFFAGSREIHHYLEYVADEFDIRRHIRFGVEVLEARYDESAAMWEADVVTADGGQETLRANIVISGVGAFNKPRMPPFSSFSSAATRCRESSSRRRSSSTSDCKRARWLLISSRSARTSARCARTASSSPCTADATMDVGRGDATDGLCTRVGAVSRAWPCAARSSADFCTRARPCSSGPSKASSPARFQRRRVSTLLPTKRAASASGRRSESDAICTYPCTRPGA